MRAAQLNAEIPHPDDFAAQELELAKIFHRILDAAGERAADRFSRFAQSTVHHEPLAAAAGVTPSTGMIAVYPTDEQAAAMAQPGGEDPAILHCTLAFLGELEPDTAEQAAAVAQQVAAKHAPLSGMVGGIGAFDDNGAGHPSILMPDVVGLAELRHAVCTALCDAGVHFVGCQCGAGEGPGDRTEHGWTPHMTMSYDESGPNPPPKHLLGRPLDFGQLTLAVGDVRRDFDLTDDPFLRDLAAAMAAPIDDSPTPGPLVIRIPEHRLELVRSIETRMLAGADDPTLTAAGTPAPWMQPHPDELVDTDKLISEFRSKSDPVRLAVVRDVMTPALDKAGLDFDVTNRFVDGVLGSTGQHIRYIADTTRLNVMRIVRRSYEAGLTIPDTASAIREGMASASVARSALIARTEMTSLVNGGSLAATQIVDGATGVGYRKKWLTAPGATFPRHETYEGLDGQETDLEGVFDVGGAELQYPGDPAGPADEVCNCRCTLIYTDSGGGEVAEEDADTAGSFTPGEEDTGAAAEEVPTGPAEPVQAAPVADEALGSPAMPAAPPPGDTISVGTSNFVPAPMVAKIKELGLDRNLDDLTPTTAVGREVFAAGKDTEALYKSGGDWSPERAKLHDKIVAAHFEGKEASGRLDAYFTSGGGASGKSAALFNSGGEDLGLKQLAGRSDTVWIDPDRVKAMLPEYSELKDAGDLYAASGVHEESSEIGKRIVAEAQRRGLSMIVDTTGSSSSFVQKLADTEAAGYDVKVTMFSIPTNEAIVRSMARAEKVGGASEGRYVAVDPLKQAHSGASRQLGIWKDSPAVSEWRVYDNSGSAPALVAEGGKAGTTIHDQGTFDQILAKGSEKPGSASTVAPSSAQASPSVATLVPGPTAETLAGVDSYQEVAIQRAAAGYRLTEDDARARLDKMVADAVKDSEVRMRVPAEILPQILESGRFKSQFEAGRSGGALSPELRSKAENVMFGYPEDLPVEQRPIYGYLSGSSYEGPDGTLSSMYGKALVRFDDSVRARSTFSLTDSLGAGERKEILPVPVNAPDHRALVLARYDTDNPLRVNPTLENISQTYAEAQIHGGLTTDSIKEIVLEKADLRDAAASLERSIQSYEEYLATAQLRIDEAELEGRDASSISLMRFQMQNAIENRAEETQTLELMKDDAAALRAKLDAAGVSWRIVDDLSNV